MISDFKECLPSQLVNLARQYLLEDHTISISENDAGCCDAIIREGNKEHWVEITLTSGTSNIVEDCYCSKCNSLLCVHTVAVLQLISKNKNATAEEHLKGYCLYDF